MQNNPNSTQVLITGASRGLGKQCSLSLASQGYHVLAAGREQSLPSLELMSVEASKLGHRISPVLLDCSKAENAQTQMLKILADFKNINILINNAGVFLDSRDEEKHSSTQSNPISTTFSTKPTTIRETWETNSLVPFILCQTIFPYLQKNKTGRIINISSGMGQLNEMNAGYPAYRISKTSLNVVTKIFSEEAKGTSITVNSVCPGWVRTDMGGSSAERSLEQGVDTILWLATSPDVANQNGLFFRDRSVIPW